MMHIGDQRLPDILCCICAVPIKANAANMCVSCLKGQVDVTEGIPKEIIMHQCRGCLKWSRPQWVSADLESRELLAICLKKITGLNKVKLVDAGWIWTEPHSKRLKLKLTVQKEVMNGAILQQSFIVTFIVRNQQCDECQASFTNHSWKAVVQVRQKVEHKRTFFYLEQLILKHRVHEKTTSIESQPDGVDFFFVERNHALRFVDFLQETVPISLKTAKKLISADNHSNTANYKFTYAVDIAPVCKDDLVALPLKLARQLGNISSLCLVTQVSSSIHVIDPFTMQRAEIDNDKYWRSPFKGIRASKALTEYTVLDSTPMEIPVKGGIPVRTNRKTRLAELEVARNADFGVNDTRYHTVSHLGMILNVGDTAMGYDLTTAVFNDLDTKPLDEAGITLPDVILVRKQFLRRVQKRSRKWKLKTIEGIEPSVPLKKADQTKHDLDYEHFLNDLEEDKEMRSRINIYKVQEQDDEDDDIGEDDDMDAHVPSSSIPLEELLDDMTMEETEGTEILNASDTVHTQGYRIPRKSTPMDLDLELRRDLNQVNERIELLATLPPADALKLSQTKALKSIDLLEKLKTWMSSGRLKTEELRLTELLSCVAEVAVKEYDYHTAEACVSWYFSLSFPRDQFYCRILFIRARCLAEKAKGMHDQQCVNQIQYALHWVMQALKLALEPTSRPHYDFLVYNASVAYWSVARPLMRPGSMRHLVDSMQSVLDGLRAVNDPDKEWIIRYEITIAAAFEDGNQLTKAGKSINDAVDHALALVTLAKADTTTNGVVPVHIVQLFEEACIFQIHLGRHKDAECVKALATAKKILVAKRQLILFNLQSIKSKITPPEGIRAALLDLFFNVTTIKFEQFTGDVASVPEEVEWDYLVEIGLVAIQNGQIDIAKSCESILAISKRLPAPVRIMSDLLRCVMQVGFLPSQSQNSHKPPTGQRPTSSAALKPVVDSNLSHLDKRQREANRLSRHVEAVKTLERSLAAAKRVGDPNLIHDICTIVWTVAVPLLEPHLRKHVHRLFQSATALLEELESPLVSLRAQMHFETAKCEMESDYLAKASTHVHKALALDYGGTMSHKQEANGKSKSTDETPPVLRHLDKHLEPMKRCLNLKSNLYGEPEVIDDQALILVEQSKEAHDKHLKATLLQKAIALLETDNEPILPTSLPSRFSLWHDITRLAWQLKNISMTRKAASKVLHFAFSLESSQAIQQGSIHFILAETFAHEIKELEKEGLTAVALRLGIALLPPGLDSAHVLVLTHAKKEIVAEILHGLLRGQEANSPWLIQNAATYLWNYHFHLFRPPFEEHLLPELIDALNTVFQALLTMESAELLPLLSSYAIAMSIVHRGQLGKVAEEIDNVLEREALAILQRKALIEIKTQMQIERGVKDAVVGETTPMKVISCLKSLELLFQQLHDAPKEEEKGILEKAIPIYQKATSLWSPVALEFFATSESTLEMELEKREFHAEVWVRLAKCALELHRSPEAQKYCELAVQPLQESNLPQVYRSKSIWRWYSVAQCIWAQAILQLAADTEAQENEIKHELALYAIQHLLLAGEFGVQATNVTLVTNAAHIMWNGMLGIMDTNTAPPYRRKLIDPLHGMLDHLTKIQCTEYEFRVDIICILLDIYEEIQSWEAGLSTVEAAFLSIPANYQRPLWRYRVIFMSKLGKSVQDGFAKMKENDVLLQARVSKRIAASSTDPGAQYKALYRAVKDLHGKVEQAPFLIEIAEWLYTNHFALDDVHDQLLGAATMLYPIIHREEESTIRKSKKKKEEETIPSLEWWHLDVQLRIYIMLAMTSHSFNERLDYVYVALGHVLAMWQALEQEHLHLLYQESYRSYADSSEASGEVVADYEEWKAHRAPTINPTFIIPKNSNEWSTFSLEANEAFLCGRVPQSQASRLMLSPTNVTQPALSIFYMKKLVEYAIEMHQLPHVLPCIWLMQLIAKGTSMTSSSSMPGLSELPLLPVYLDVKLSQVLGTLLFTEQSQSCLKRAIDALRQANEPRSSVSSNDESVTKSWSESSRRHRPLISSKYNVFELCTEIADMLLEGGYHLQVKILLDLTAVYCQAAHDDLTLAYVDFCRGKLHLLEGDIVVALQHFQLATNTNGLELGTYVKFVVAYAESLRLHSHFKQSKAVLLRAVHAVEEIDRIPMTFIQGKLHEHRKTPIEQDIDILAALATLRAIYASVLLHESVQLMSTGGEWRSGWAEATRLLTASIQVLQNAGGAPRLVKIATDFSSFLVQHCSNFDSQMHAENMKSAKDTLLAAHAYLESIWQRVDTEAGSIGNPALALSLSQLKYDLCQIELQEAEIGVEKKMVVYQLESDAKKSLIELWLERTAPKHERSANEMNMKPLDKALLYLNGAVNLTRFKPVLKYQASLAHCIRSQLLPCDDNWTFADESQRKLGVAGSISPVPFQPEEPSLECIRMIQSTLDQAVKLRDRPAIEQCTFELLQCYACRDPAQALKYQSCRASAVAEGLFLEACAPTNRSALFFQRVRQLSPTSAPAQLAMIYLDTESEAWRRLGVSTTIEQSLTHVPPNFILFSLQFSPDGRYLYGGVQGGALTIPYICRMEFHQPRRETLDTLVSKMKAWRLSTVKSLLQYSDIMQGEQDRFEFLGDSTHDDTLETHFQSIIQETRDLLAPVLQGACLDAISHAKGTNPDDTQVVFLVDSILANLPFEAIIDVIDSRDMSVHMLASRLQNYKQHPYKRDDLYYIADPQYDEPETDDPHSIQATINSLKTSCHGLKGLCGKKYVPSSSEWQTALMARKGGGFLFYGPNRSLAHFPPCNLAGLNATRCNLVVSMSRTENYMSYRRQSKLDTHKTKRLLSLEDGWESALLWSLSGVNCVVTNQWNTTFLANHRVLIGLFSQMNKNVSIAKAIKCVGDVWVASQNAGHGKNVKYPPGTILKGRVRYNPIVYGLPHIT